jgi:hypothetical protein
MDGRITNTCRYDALRPNAQVFYIYLQLNSVDSYSIHPQIGLLNGAHLSATVKGIMSYRLGIKRACSYIVVGGSLAWAMAGCAATPQGANEVASQSAALTVAGAPAEEPPMGPPDEIQGPFSYDLDGLSLTYHYTHGGDYYISYGRDTVTFRLPLPDGSHTPPITVPYFVRALRANMYMIHWVNPERTVHVTQVLDLPHREVQVAALMPGQWQLFDVGQITEMSRAAQ